MVAFGLKVFFLALLDSVVGSLVILPLMLFAGWLAKADSLQALIWEYGPTIFGLSLFFSLIWHAAHLFYLVQDAILEKEREDESL